MTITQMTAVGAGWVIVKESYLRMRNIVENGTKSFQVGAGRNVTEIVGAVNFLVPKSVNREIILMQ